MSSRADSDRGEPPAERPLAGVRIADFTFQGAGAYAAMLLGALGAEIIKIESSRRPDPTRGRENRPYLHSLLFDDVNQSKRSIAIDMKHEAGIELARQLIKRSDAVMDNFRPGVMQSWGLTFDSLLELNPRLVAASLSAVGHEGPLHVLPGYAGIFNAFSGLGELTGYRGGPPTELRTSVDMRAGAFFAFSVVQGLLDARRHGTGMRIDFSAAEAMTALSGEHLTAHELGLRVGERHGNADEQYEPHGIFTCADGRWVCIAVRGEVEASRLAERIRADGVPAGELDGALADWVGGITSQQVAAALDELAVPFGFVLDAEAMSAEPQHAHRGYFTEVAASGRTRTVAAAPWTFGGARPATSLGPELGEHTDEVLTESGYDRQRIGELHARGVLR